MQLQVIAADSVVNTLDSLWPLFAPELIICITIMVMLIVRLFRWGQQIPPFLLALAGALCALFFIAPKVVVVETIPRQTAITGVLILSATIIVILILRQFRWGRRIPTFLLALGGVACALYFAAPKISVVALESVTRQEEIFTGMLVYDTFSVFMRALLLVFSFPILALLRLVPKI